MAQPLLQTKLYRIEYGGVKYFGPHLSHVLAHINLGIEHGMMKLTATGMSNALRGKSKSGKHKNATGEIFFAEPTFSLPPGAIWVGGPPPSCVKDGDAHS
jgi:hypothetical protein